MLLRQNTQNSHCMQLVWRNGNSVRHINEVKLRRARLVLGLVMTFGGSTIQVFIQGTQPAYPSVVRCNEYRNGLGISGKKRRL